MTLTNELRTVLEGTPVAHVATVNADGAPHSVPMWITPHGDRVAIMTGPHSRKYRNMRRDARIAISLTPPDNPFQPIILHGRIVEWVTGDAGWQLVDEIATKYIGQPYGRDQERVVALIELA